MLARPHPPQRVHSNTAEQLQQKLSKPAPFTHSTSGQSGLARAEGHDADQQDVTAYGIDHGKPSSRAKASAYRRPFQDLASSQQLNSRPAAPPNGVSNWQTTQHGNAHESRPVAARHAQLDSGLNTRSTPEAPAVTRREHALLPAHPRDSTDLLGGLPEASTLHGPDQNALHGSGAPAVGVGAQPLLLPSCEGSADPVVLPGPEGPDSPQASAHLQSLLQRSLLPDPNQRPAKSPRIQLPETRDEPSARHHSGGPAMSERRPAGAAPSDREATMHASIHSQSCMQQLHGRSGQEPRLAATDPDGWSDSESGSADEQQPAEIVIQSVGQAVCPAEQSQPMTLQNDQMASRDPAMLQAVPVSPTASASSSVALPESPASSRLAHARGSPGARSGTVPTALLGPAATMAPSAAVAPATLSSSSTLPEVPASKLRSAVIPMLSPAPGDAQPSYLPMSAEQQLFAGMEGYRQGSMTTEPAALALHEGFPGAAGSPVMQAPPLISGVQVQDVAAQPDGHKQTGAIVPNSTAVALALQPSKDQVCCFGAITSISHWNVKA